MVIKYSEEYSPKKPRSLQLRSSSQVEVSEDTILACEFAFEIDDTTDGCLFFDSNGTLNYSFAQNDGAHNLYRLEEKQ